MARYARKLDPEAPMAERLALAALLRAIPRQAIDQVLEDTGKHSQRQRLLPAHVAVYYVIAMALFMPVAYREVLRWLLAGVERLRPTGAAWRIADKAAISRARSRLGVAPLKCLYERVVRPVAAPGAVGAWYRQWRLISLDGTTLEVADTAANVAALGRPPASRGRSAFPQIRLVSLVEQGSHVLFGAALGPYRVGESTVAAQVVPALGPDQLCLADRGFFGYRLWMQAAATGAALLWRLQRHVRLDVVERYADGSYRSLIYPRWADRKRGHPGVPVRVIEYRLAGVAADATRYRLLTTILDPAQAPAAELAALYHQRWEIEVAFDELKTHLRGRQLQLRSKLPELVEQECYGLLLAHYAIRSLMQEAAQSAALDPDRLSYLHAVRVIRRRLPAFAALSPSGASRCPSRPPSGAA